MAIEVVYWLCEVCLKAYSTRAEALRCEEHDRRPVRWGGAVDPHVQVRWRVDDTRIVETGGDDD